MWSNLLYTAFNLQGSAGVDNPGSKQTGASDRHSLDPLDQDESATFRRLAGVVLYLSQDRPSLQYPASQVMEGMASDPHAEIETYSQVCPKIPRGDL